MTSSKDNYNSLIHASCEMIGTVTGKWTFSTAIQVVKGERQLGGNIGILRMEQNSKKLSATKEPSMNAYSYVPNKRVTG